MPSTDKAMFLLIVNFWRNNALKGLSHLAQDKKKNAEMQNCMVAFFFFNRFFTHSQYLYTASG